MKLIFATNNKNKAIEIQHLVGDAYSIQTLKDIGCVEDIDENGTTLQENASIKSRYVVDHYHTDCFADDTGLLVESLGGAPGVYSARYAGSQRSDDDNMSLLMKNLEGKESRDARFTTVISLILDKKEYLFEGELRGKIGVEKRGTNGFGYDPIFIPEGYTQTLAELSLTEKNAISHRAKAFLQLREFLVKRRQA
jgi:XTP/dITP diphosphohydrolase